MRLRPLCVVVFVSLVLPATADAHLHVWDFGFSGAEASGSSLKGTRLTIGITQQIGSTNKDFSWLGDITNLKGHDDATNEDITQISYLGGGRYTIPRLRHKYFALTVHGIGGFVYRQRAADGQRNWAFNSGAAVELGDAKGWAGRIQLDYSFLEGNAKGFRQISGGVVKRFEP